MKDSASGCLILTLIFIGVFVVVYGFVALLTYLIFLCFGFASSWNWFIPLGLLLIGYLLKFIFGKGSK